MTRQQLDPRQEDEIAVKVNMLFNLEIRRYQNSIDQEKWLTWIGIIAFAVGFFVVMLVVVGFVTDTFHVKEQLTPTLIVGALTAATSTIIGVVFIKLSRELSRRSGESHKAALEVTKLFQVPIKRQVITAASKTPKEAIHTEIIRPYPEGLGPLEGPSVNSENTEIS